MSPKAASTTLAAEIQGILNYCDEWVRKPNVKGVILNNISSGYYNLLKPIIETHCNIKFMDMLPKDEEMSLKSRHLGLIQCSEVEDIDYKINKCSEYILSNVNMDELIDDFDETKKYEDNFHIENKNLKIAIAKDEAFSFYYRGRNLELFEEVGEVVYFSPLHDEKLPDNVDFYI